MYIKNRVISLVYKCIAVIIAFVGIYLNSGLPNGKLEPAMFLYYTIISNIICLAYFIAAAISVVKAIKKDGIHGESTLAIHLKGAVLMAITVTMLIYWFIFVGEEFTMADDTSRTANLIVHLFVPLITILDWLLFEVKGKLSVSDPFKWLIIPLCYYLFTVIGAFCGIRYMDGNRYPYFFIDSDVLGWGKVVVSVFVLVLVFLAIGFVVFGIDRGLCKLEKRIKKVA